jgi:methyltransferase (TIGR00027 family)
MTMPDNESAGWDLASGVGATATMVAAGRAIASKDPRRLIDDPFAQPLVEAVGLDFFIKQVRGELDTTDMDERALTQVRSLVNDVAVRTKFIDEYFLNSADRGVRQVVILASGLDARAYRLNWPPGTVVYEIDQPAVLTFKTTTLAALGARPIAERRTVGCDLREDWVAALRDNGFQPERPTAWSAEGLLMYLSAEAQDRIVDEIAALSAPGSALAADYIAGPRQLDESTVDDWRQKGFTLDMASMTFTSEHCRFVENLQSHGWQVEIVPRADLYARYDVALSTVADDLSGPAVYLQGRRMCVG